MDARGYILLEWVDEIRTWNHEFPLLCLDSIIMPPGTDSGIWLPDIALTTANSFYELLKGDDSYDARVNSDGKTQFVPGGFIRFQCKSNLKLFPFDSMQCWARFESWFYSVEAQIFNEEMSMMFDYNWTEHEQWRLDSYKMEIVNLYSDTSDKTHANAVFHITLARKSGFYLMNIIVPSVILSTLELATFALPSGQTLRIELSFMCLFAYTMFQSMISEDLPKSADQTPLLSIYMVTMIMYVAVAIFFQCIIITLNDKAYIGSNVPRWLIVVGPKFGLPYIPDDDDQIEDVVDAVTHHSDLHVLKSRRKRAYRKLWIKVYHVVDYFGAFLYLLLFVATTVFLLLIVPMYPFVLDYF